MNGIELADSGGHMRGFAWGPPVVDEITMGSLDRYRLTVADRPWVLIVQPQQTTIWFIPDNQPADGGAAGIDGDGIWMFLTVVPDVTVGQPMNVHLAFTPDEEPVFWHNTSPVTSVTATLDGRPVDGMTTGQGAKWLITTRTGAIHEFDFAELFPRHRRFASGREAVANSPGDRYVETYSLYDIQTLKIGQPINIDARRLTDEHQFTESRPVTTITNLFDTTKREVESR